MNKLLILIALLNVASLSAKELNLENWLDEELNSHQLILAEVEASSPRSQLLLSTFRVRLRASVTAEIPLVAKGKVRPEIELYFKK
jgi:hypothetical protein